MARGALTRRWCDRLRAFTHKTALRIPCVRRRCWSDARTANDAFGTGGFTLFELMVVVLIIAIIAVIVIPSLFNARKSANETSAIAFLRMAGGVNIQYRVRFGTYPSQPDYLFAAGFIHPSQDPSGYSLNLVSTSAAWSLEANPEVLGETGDRCFYVDETGVIRSSLTAPATSTSPPIGES